MVQILSLTTIRGIKKTKQRAQHSLALLDPCRPLLIYGEAPDAGSNSSSPCFNRPAPSAGPPSIKPGAEGRRRHPAEVVAWDRGCASCQKHLHAKASTALFFMLPNLFSSSASLCRLWPFFCLFFQILKKDVWRSVWFFLLKVVN